LNRNTAKADADRNLLFAVLALRTELVRREDMLSAMSAWAADRDKPLGQILVEKGMLRPDRRGWIEAMVDTHLEGGHDLISTLPMTAGLMHSLASQPGDATPSGSLAAEAGTVVQEPAALPPSDVTLPLPRSTDATIVLPHPHGDTTETVARPGARSERSRYRILRPHAHGGLGQVFLALDQELGREVALKEIREDQADDSHRRARFVLEAEITGGLEHPGVVPVYSLNWYENGRPYYAMRFIRGESFDQIIERYHADPAKHLDPSRMVLDFRRMLRRFIDVCNAIAYAHSRGVLHRDIKPQNIMLGKYGETLVVDWGLAKSISQPDISGYSSELQLTPTSASGTAETMPGSAIGTPQFMSPEQAAGDLEKTGPASDIYSLGATLYCLLTGHVAFENPDVAITLRMVQRGVFPAPRVHEPALSPALEAICMKAMALRPEDRYATPKALAEEIEDWLADEPVAAYPEPWTARFARWRRRHRAWTTAGAVGLVLIALVASLVAAGIRRAQKNTERLNAGLILDRALTRCQNGEPARGMLELAYGLEYLRGQDLVLDRSFRRNLDGWSHRLLPLRYLLTHRGMVDAVAFSPGGNVFLTAGGVVEAGKVAGEVHLWDAATGDRLWSTVPLLESEVRAAVFDPKGARFAIGQDNGWVQLYNVSTRRPIGKALRYGSRVTSLAFSPDGRLFVAGGHGSQVVVWDAQAPATRPLHTLEHPAPVLAVAFSLDSTHIAAGCDDGYAYIWSVSGEAGTRVRTSRRHDGPVRAVAFHPQKSMLVTGGLDGIIRVWNTSDGSLAGRRPITQAVGVYAVAFRPPRGDVIASGTEDNNVQLYDPLTSEPYALPIEHEGSVISVAFSPDGRTLLTGCQDQYARTWEIPAAPSAQEVARHQGRVTALEFGPGAESVLTAGEDGVVRLRSRAGEDLGPPHSHPGPVLSVALSHDGRLAVSGSADGLVRAWDPTAAGSRERIVARHETPVTSLRLRPGDTAVVSGSEDGWVRVTQLDANAAPPAAFFHVETVAAVDFHPNGKAILTAGGDSVKIWDVSKTNGPVQAILHPGQVYAARFRRDGTRILSGGENNTAQLWDPQTGRAVGPPMIHEGAIRSLSFGPQGLSVLTASNDRTARLWDSRDGTPLGPPMAHADRVTAVAYGPLLNDDLVATGTEHGVVRTWTIPYPIEGSAERLKTWVEVSTGLTLEVPDGGTTGIVRVLKPKDLAAKRLELRRLGGAPTGHATLSDVEE
jgi:WD40 repeat protein/tRNA A-37 threonylcarbamoyl transferase component Bud32